ncbi:hypothetical protein ZWY2020_003747, partial [Hordeum vulgare]
MSYRDSALPSAPPHLPGFFQFNKVSCGAARGCRRQQDMMPHGDGNGHARTDAAGRISESITAGNGSKDLSKRFLMSSSDDTNSNILFSVPGSKKAKVLRSIRARCKEGKLEFWPENGASLRYLFCATPNA